MIYRDASSQGRTTLSRATGSPIDAAARPSFRQTVVGIDFSPGGLAAVDLARRLTVDTGRMTLVHIVLTGDELAWRSGEHEVLAAQARSMWLLDRERRLALARDPAPRCAVRTQSIIAGSPGRGLAHVAEALGADLVVIGQAHRHRWRPGIPDALLRGSWTVALASPDGTGIFR